MASVYFDNNSNPNPWVPFKDNTGIDPQANPHGHVAMQFSAYLQATLGNIPGAGRDGRIKFQQGPKGMQAVIDFPLTPPVKPDSQDGVTFSMMEQAFMKKMEDMGVAKKGTAEKAKQEAVTHLQQLLKKLESGTGDLTSMTTKPPPGSTMLQRGRPTVRPGPQQAIQPTPKSGGPPKRGQSAEKQRPRSKSGTRKDPHFIDTQGIEVYYHSPKKLLGHVPGPVPVNTPKSYTPEQAELHTQILKKFNKYVKGVKKTVVTSTMVQIQAKVDGVQTKVTVPQIVPPDAKSDAGFQLAYTDFKTQCAPLTTAEQPRTATWGMIQSWFTCTTLAYKLQHSHQMSLKKPPVTTEEQKEDQKEDSAVGGEPPAPADPQDERCVKCQAAFGPGDTVCSTCGAARK